MKLYTSLHVIF